MSNHVRQKDAASCADCGQVLEEDLPHICQGSVKKSPLNQPVGSGDQPTIPGELPENETPDPAQELLGQIIGERYEIQRVLGQGGMGVVYQARHISLEKLLAVKLLLIAQNEEYQRRFLQEAQLASQINHPNTVFLSDFGVLPDGRSYIVMELLRGPTLAKEIADGPMDALRACKIAAQIANGLQAVHDQGIIHRDLKPENVFLLEQDGKRDNVKIVDFGIAKATANAPMVRNRNSQEDLRPLNEQRISSQTMPGTLMGTPAYLAPEMALGHEVDFRADQYSLGVILFEMVTGALPFEATTIGQMLQHHVATKPPLLSQKAARVSPSMDALTARLLAKAPHERFPSMRAVAEALEKEIELHLLSRGDSSLPRHIAEALHRTRQGTRIVIAGRTIPLWLLVPVLLLFLVGGGAIGLLAWQKQSTKAAITPEELAHLRQQALAVLAAHAKGTDPALRAKSAFSFSLTRDTSLRENLETLLKDAAESVQVGAALALGTLGDRQATGALTQALAGTKRVRLAAAKALAQLTNESGHKILREAATSKDTAVAAQAALYLCEMGDATVRRVLSQLHNVGALKEDDDFSALTCLVQLGDEAARAELSAKSDAGTDRKQKIEALSRLAALGDESARKNLRALAEKRGSEQLLAANRLAGPDEPQLVHVFRPLIENEFAVEAARQLAAEGVGKSGDLPHVRELGPLMKDTAPQLVRHEAAAAILRLASSDPGLLTTASLAWAQTEFQTGSTKRRLLAIQVLGDLPSSQAVSLLAVALADDATEVRQAAAASLGHRNERTAMTLLLESALDPDEKVRRASLQALLELSGRLHKKDSEGLLQASQGVLKEILQRGSAAEKALALAVLHRLGDRKQADILRTLAAERNSEVAHLLIDALANDLDFVATFLNDPTDSVRQHAAKVLVLASDKRATPVLKAFYAVGGVDGLWAAGLLHRLGEPHNLSADLSRLLHSNSVEERIAAVQALRDADPAMSYPLLRAAMADAAPEVRRAVAQVAAQMPKGPNGFYGMPLLRVLSQDDDPTVWTYARALLARMRTPEGASVVEPTLPPRRLPSRTEPPKTTDTETPKDVPTAKLSLMSHEAVYFHIGKRPWQQAPASVDLPHGKHLIETLNGEHEVEIAANGAQLELSESGAEKYLRIGMAAAKNSDSKRALTNLERARALCQKDKKHHHDPPCYSIVFDASYHQGRLHEAAKDLHLAMESYIKALEQGEKVKGRSDLKNQLTESTTRLKARVGQVVIKSQVNGRCESKVYWMLPARHQVRDGQGRSVSVDLRAGDRREVGSCSGEQ